MEKQINILQGGVIYFSIVPKLKIIPLKFSVFFGFTTSKLK